MPAGYPKPEGPSIQCLMSLVPKAIDFMALGKYWVRGPPGLQRLPGLEFRIWGLLGLGFGLAGPGTFGFLVLPK